MKIKSPETAYERMIFLALANKLRANHSKKKKSQRDERREYNATHSLQLPMRSHTGKPSLQTHQMVVTPAYIEDEPLPSGNYRFHGRTIERREIV